MKNAIKIQMSKHYIDISTKNNNQELDNYQNTSINDQNIFIQELESMRIYWC